MDLDGTYIKTDLLYESALVFVRQNILRLLALPFLLLMGKARVKDYLAKKVSLDIGTLPRNKALADFLHGKKLEGYGVYLVSAASELFVKSIVRKDKLFDGGYGSSREVNLKGKEKVRLLEKKFPQGFIYAGDSVNDLHVWEKSSAAVVVNAAKYIEKKAAGLTNVEKIFPRDGFYKLGRLWLRQIRLYQWVKNLLIFLPIALVHETGNLQLWKIAGSGFIILSLLASATYILNDLVDLQDDRKHWSKSSRPLASGGLWIGDAIKAFIILSVFPLYLAFELSHEFGYALLVYFIITVLYSFVIKKIALLDVVVLSGLFTLRIIMGAVLIGVESSVWLLSFSAFFFLSLVIIKRLSELQKRKEKKEERGFGRSYQIQDIQFLSQLSVATGIASVVLMILYLLEHQYEGKGYAIPELLWVIPVCILLSLGRIAMETARGKMQDDPIVFALTDRFCLCVIAVAVFAFISASGAIW